MNIKATKWQQAPGKPSGMACARWMQTLNDGIHGTASVLRCTQTGNTGGGGNPELSWLLYLYTVRLVARARRLSRSSQRWCPSAPSETADNLLEKTKTRIQFESIHVRFLEYQQSPQRSTYTYSHLHTVAPPTHKSYRLQNRCNRVP